MNKIKCFVFLVLLLFLAGCVRNNNPKIRGIKTQSQADVFHRSYYLDQDFFDRSYRGVKTETLSKKVYGGIIPHHLLASHLIAEFFKGLEKYNQPEIVVLIGPNHREVGDYNILSSQAEWITPYGNLEPASEIIETLKKKGIIRVEEGVFATEHSISAEVSFIKRSFPNTKLVPIVLKTRTKNNETEELAKALTEVLPKSSLVIGSLDFAHKISSKEADQLDAQSIKALQSLNVNRIDEITVDSKPTINVLFHYLNKKQATESILLNESNAAKVTGDLSLPEVTSYITIYFL